MKYYSFSAFVALAIFCICIALPIHAAKQDSTTQSQDTIELDKQIISSKKNSKSSPGLKTIIIDENQGRYTDIASLLASEAGLVVRRSGAIGDFAELAIRGGSSKDVTIFLDGIPLNGSTSGNVDIGKLSLSNMKEINVYKEIPPFELMDQGLGQVISLHSIQGNTVRGVAELGSFGLMRLVGSAGGGKDAHYSLSFDITRSKNNYPYNNDNGTAINATDDFIDNKINNSFRNMNGQLSFRSGSIDNTQVSLTLSSQAYNKHVFLTGISDSDQIAFQKSWNCKGNLSLDKSISETTYLKAAVQARLSESTVNEGERWGEEIIHKDRAPFVSAHVMASHDWSDAISSQLRLLGSKEFYLLKNYQDLNYPTEPTFTRSGISLGLQTKINKDHITFMLAGVQRVDFDESSGAFRSGQFVVERVKKTNFLPHIQARLQYAPFENISFPLSISFHKRSPTFSEAFSRSAWAVGNNDLKPEGRIDVSLGGSLKIDFFENNVSLYGGTTRDKIISTINSQGIFRPANYSNVGHIGAELFTKYSLLKTIYLTNDLSYGFNKFYDIAIVKLEWKDEPLIPRFRDNLRIGFCKSIFTAEYDIQFKSKYFLDSYNEDAVRGKPIQSLFAKINNNRFSLSYCLENFTNIYNYDFRDQPLPGISHYFTVTYK